MSEPNLDTAELTIDTVERMIYEIRGERVMLDFDLARVYGYSTRRFNEQVKNNIHKFPDDFMFQITEMEQQQVLRSKKSTANNLSSKRRYKPYAFTEQGIYMLMTVLNGELATKQSIALIKAFKKMKDYLISSNCLINTNELLRLSNQVNQNTNDIENIEKKLEVVMDNFIDPSKYKEFVFLCGEKIEADIAYQNIYSQAKKTILIVDDYIDIKTFYLLRSAKKDVEIIVFTDNKAKNSLAPEFIIDFTNTNNKLCLYKTNNQCHDRLIVLDYKEDNEEIYVCGSSSKDSGNKATTITRISSIYLFHELIDSLFNNNPLTLL